ncbi:MAG: glycyl-radical enzyme activating protein [Planctomycetia bacterium]|nr:glycyl-radical enzyme activating protein [Planctomycetia bacterium]
MKRRDAPMRAGCPDTEPMNIFNVQKYSIHDGPGIRTTVFLKGCPLRCTWCHNPEGQRSAPERWFDRRRCLGSQCAACAAVCPVGLRDEDCTACGKCADVCPTDARAVVGRRIPSQELLDVILRDELVYRCSGGGVTFSGGEPLTQPGPLADLLRLCREHEIHTAVDT